MDTLNSVIIDYTNWRGVREMREIVPHIPFLTFRATAWHPEQQWILTAYDVAKGGEREFAMISVHGWHKKGTANEE